MRKIILTAFLIASFTGGMLQVASSNNLGNVYACKESEPIVIIEPVIIEVPVGSIIEQNNIEDEVIEEAIINSVQYETLPVISNSSAKTYEDYKLITCTSSPQYDLIYNQNLFTVQDNGFLVTEDGYYAVALGSYFGNIGSKYIFWTDEGNEIKVIKTDAKKDEHTDSYNFAGINAGDVLEFVVDTSKMPIWENGYCYGGNLNNVDFLKGNITEIIVVEKID